MNSIKPFQALRLGIITSIAVLTIITACFDIPELWDSTQSGKLIAFCYITTALCLLMAIRCIYLKELVVRLNMIDILLGLFLLLTILNRNVTAEENSYSKDFYELPGLVLTYIAVRSVKKATYKLLFIAIVAGGVIQSVYGLLQLYNFIPSHVSSFKINGSFFNPGPYAGYLASVFPVITGLYLFRSTIFNCGGSKLTDSAIRVAAVFVIPVMLLALSGTLSRAAWLAVFVSTVFLLSRKYKFPAMFKRIFTSTLTRRIGLSLIFFLITGGCAFLYFLKKASAEGRLLIWKVTARMIAAHPIAGVGSERFRACYMDYQKMYFQTGGTMAERVHADNIYYAFNDPLQFIAENGLIGLLLLMAIILMLLKLRTFSSPLLSIAGAGLLSVSVFSLFSYPMAILPIKLNFVIYLSLLSSGSVNNKIITLKPALPSPSIQILRLVVMASLLLGTVWVSRNIRVLYNAYSDWQTAMSLYQMQFYTESINFYKKAYPVFRQEGDFLMHYGKALSMEKEDAKALDKLHEAIHYLNTTIIQTTIGDSYKSLKMYDSAESAYLNASYMLPDRVYPKYLLAKLYEETGQKEKATITANDILRHNSRIPSEAIDEMDMEMEQLLNQYRVPIVK